LGHKLKINIFTAIIIPYLVSLVAIDDSEKNSVRKWREISFKFETDVVSIPHRHRVSLREVILQDLYIFSCPVSGTWGKV